jgi:hypothetical protein
MVDRDLRVQTFALISGDNAKDYANGIYNQLKVLGQLTDESSVSTYSLEAFKRVPNHRLKMLQEIVDELTLKVTQLYAIYGVRFTEGYVKHENHYVNANATVVDTSCNICKRGVVLVRCVKELRSLIMYLLCYSSFYEKFKTGIRNLRKTLIGVGANK